MSSRVVHRAIATAESNSGLAVAEIPRQLAERRIYFGHQSVGADIVAGLASLFQERPDSRLNVVETRDLAIVCGPAFIHFRVGCNGDPDSKNAEFLRVLAARRGPDRGIALLKYCYVDVSRARGARALFEGYERTVQSIRLQCPDLTIVHVTLPLTTVEDAWRATLKKWAGRETARALSRERQKYNALMHTTYGGHEPIFDIAGIESTRVDGSRTYFSSSRDPVFSLAPELTHDGGHLNDAGRRCMAEHLLSVLGNAGATTADSPQHVR